MDDHHGSPGRWFWPCFEPLRSEFNELFWVFSNQPWMGAPGTFDHDREIAHHSGSTDTSVQLWRPGAIGRWAERFSEEQIELWAVAPGEDPPQLAFEFSRTFETDNEFIDRHAEFWLMYLDSAYWEIFARQPEAIKRVREGLKDNPSIRIEETWPDRQDELRS